MDCVDFALACYRTPLAYQERLSLAAPLPDGMDRLLWLANGSPEAVEAAALLTSARPQELQDAARFCVQQLCFARGASPYRVLGLEPDAAPERIKEHHRLLMRLFHPDRTAGRETWTESYATRVNEAWTALSRLSSHAAPGTPPSQSMLTLDGFSPAPRSLQTATDLPPPPPRFTYSSRHRFRVPSQWLPGLVLGGLALAATVVLAGLYLDKLDRAANQPTEILAGANGAKAATDPVTASEPAAERSAMAAFLAAPDWKVLEQRERQAQRQAAQVEEARQQLEQDRQKQLAAEEIALERMRAERAQLEEQLKVEQARVQQVKTERLAVEQQRLDRLKADLMRLEQAKAERLTSEQRRLEALQAEQTKTERLIEELHVERRRLEQARIEQARIVRAKAESVRVEPVRLDDSQETERARTERLRLEAQLQTERAKAEQAKVERTRLEAQLQAERAKAEQTSLNVAAADDHDLTARELDELIGRYVRAYERGNLGDIMALFTTDIRNERSRIRQDYAALLATHQVRQLQLRGLHWAYQGESASGAGRYQLQLERRNGGEPTQVEGNIRFRVRKQHRQVLIEAIDYDWPSN